MPTSRRSRPVESGTLDGQAYLRLGEGPPLVVLPGLTAHHDHPAGVERRFEVQQLTRYAGAREVWWLQRPARLPAGTTMGDLAARYADALAGRFARPVDVLGISTGGSVALQLAADSPDVVRRLALVSSACRLGAEGRQMQRDLAVHLRAGRRRAAGATMMSTIGVRPWSRRVMAGAGWLLGPQLMAGDVSDMLATIDAEDAFDVTDRLAGISVPTLVVGGARDPFYGEALLRQTAEGLGRGGLLLYPGKGHAAPMSSPRTAEAVLRHLGP